jgi:amidophosphoribosyltransferase
MCGITGISSSQPVNQLIYDSLLLLQHRGQDAAGIATMEEAKFFSYKATGLVNQVFRTRNMRTLLGNTGIGQVRYSTAGDAYNDQEAQPFYVNAPFGIMLVHNGNISNSEELRQELFAKDRRHINTDSDTEVLLSVFADELHKTSGASLEVADIFRAVKAVHRRLKGSYAIIAMISGYGLLAFRDPYGIRPLAMGQQKTEHGIDYMFASESVAIEGIGFELVRDLEPAEMVFIDMQQNIYRDISTESDLGFKPQLVPCIFEYVYLARPDSSVNNIPVYEARLKIGEYLAKKVQKHLNIEEIDVVMPIPDSSRPAAMQLAKMLNLPYCEGFFKNRYVGRTFIMPGQAVRKKSVKQKLNTLNIEFKDKNILIVDDSIVRGTTSLEIVQMARMAGAKKIFFASAAPAIRHTNIYGINMPTHQELIAYQKTDQEVCQYIQADALIYQDIEDLEAAILELAPTIERFESSCFTGDYIV